MSERKMMLIKAEQDYKKGTISRDQYFFIIFDMLKKYIDSLIKKYSRLLNAEMDDLMQEASLAVLTHLDEYKPMISTPETFFGRYINESHRNLCLKGKSIYYLRVAKFLEKVASDAGFSGMDDADLSDATLADLTGISEVTVKNTRKHMSMYSSVSISTESEEPVYIKTPEDIVMKEIEKDAIMNRITNILTPGQKMIFILFVVNELSAKEIIDKLGEDDLYKKIGFKKMPSESTIRQTIFVSKKKLRDKLNYHRP